MKQGCLMLVLLCFLGCSGSSSSSDAVPASLGTAPVIENVDLAVLIGNSYYETNSFDIGDWGNFGLTVTDPDLDIISVYVTQFYPQDSTTPYRGPDLVSLPTQTDPTVLVYLIDPVEVLGPAGTRRIEFTVVDASGLESSVFRIYMTIH